MANVKGKNNPMYSHGMSGTSFYNSWRGAKGRCRNINNSDYKNYGGRGICFSEDWDKFEDFYEDIFKCFRKGLTLDRIDVNGNYCKENCRWVTMKEQIRNTRVNRIIEFEGESKCLAEWAEIKELKQDTLKRRLDKLGWTVEEALTYKNRERRIIN